MGLNDIEKRSRGYELLKVWVRFWHNHIFYRNYTIIGKEKIPFGKPMIFTPNHSNALMDALAVLFSSDILFVFLARADIFKNPKIASILYFLKILPIYRVRDGFDTVKKSKDILRKASDIIMAGDAMVILPEGNHSRIRRLRPLKKGFARMAFQTEELNDYNLDLHIVPVGIDYDNFTSYRSSLVMTFGDPVPVSQFVDGYKQNPPIALNKIKNKLSENLAPVLINIKSEEYYDLYNNLRFLFRDITGKEMGLDSNLDSNRVKIDQATVKKIEIFERNNINEFKSFNEKVTMFYNLKEKLGLTDIIIKSKGKNCGLILFQLIGLLGFLPVFIYGFLNNIIAYYIPIAVTRKFKDEQFVSSVKFVVSALLFPLLYILQTSIVIGFTNFTTGLLYLASLPITGIMAWAWSGVFLKFKTRFKFIFNKVSNSSDQNKIISLYDELHVIMTTKILNSTENQ